MENLEKKLLKPYLRGHFHQAGFFFFLGASLVLMAQAENIQTFFVLFVYSISLNALFATSALYHRPNWEPAARMWMKRLDHAAIYVLIAGTGTPLLSLSLKPESLTKVLTIIWIVAIFGILQSLFWVKAPKWVSSILYVIAGYIVVPYFKEMHSSLGDNGIALIISGGFFYTVGAVIYAVKKPNPYPKYFGYHEIFHLLVILGAAFHFVAVYKLVKH
jgi:hemolysin III